MSSIQAKDLIQAKALGCLDPDDDANMNKLMEEDVEFPWQEFGQYQNLIAFLPTLLDIESPEQYVKDNVATRLSELESKRKAAEMPEPEPIPEPEPEPELLSELEDLPDLDDPILDTPLIEDQVEDELPERMIDPHQDVKFNEEVLEEKMHSKRGISFKDHGMPQVPAREEESPEEKVVEDKKPVELKPDRINRGPVLRLPRKDFENKNVKSYVSKTPPPAPVEPKVVEIVKKDKLGFITAIVLFIITLLILAFMYFKFSGEIQKNKDDIEGIKKMFSLEDNSSLIIHHPDFS